MKRFLLAVVLALSIHGLFLGFGPKLLSKIPPAKPKPLTVTFSFRQQPEAGPGPELKHPIPSPDEVVRTLKKKAEKPVVNVVKPEPQKEIPQEPETGPGPEVEHPVPSPDEVVKAPKKNEEKPAFKPEPRKKIPKPPEKVVLPEKKVVVKKKPKPLPKPVKAIIKPQKKRSTDTVQELASAAKVNPVLPRAEGKMAVESTPDLLPDISPDLMGNVVSETEVKIASVRATKKVIKARPAYRENPRPAYPRMARRRGYEGTVLLEVLVDSAGKVEDLRVLKSSGYKVLDRSAIKSAKNWLFEPGSIGDEKVEMWVRIPIRFELRN